jgi:uncharacterized protein YqhQ
MQKIVLGGQAVLEGVLMKSQKNVAIAVRKPNGKIAVKKERLYPASEKYPILGLPLIRGVVNLIEMLVVGIKAISYSAEQSGEEGDMDDKKIWFTISTSLFFSIILFIVFPFYLTKMISVAGLLFNLVDGIIRIAILLAYIFLISNFIEIKRLFQYHGAEHMAVACFEHGEKLKAANVKKFSPLHPRCGTNFLVIVLLASIAVFSLITPASWTLKLVLRIVLIPVIAGISYEILRLGGRYHENWAFRIVNYPGLMLQKITTRKPNKAQIEVAIRAIDAILRLEKEKP